MNRQNRNRLIYTKIILMVVKGRRVGGLGEKGERIKDYELAE